MTCTSQFHFVIIYISLPNFNMTIIVIPYSLLKLFPCISDTSDLFIYESQNAFLSFLERQFNLKEQMNTWRATTHYQKPVTPPQQRRCSDKAHPLFSGCNFGWRSTKTLERVYRISKAPWHIKWQIIIIILSYSHKLSQTHLHPLPHHIIPDKAQETKLGVYPHFQQATNLSTTTKNKTI